MKNKKYVWFCSGAFLGILWFVFYTMMPHDYGDKNTSLAVFSTQRALEKVKQISKNPHYVGSKNHDLVANYLFLELKKMNLQPHFEEGYTMTKNGTLVFSKNIIAKIKGSSKGKALLLVSHYDSAPHTKSLGASDDASGIATILETVRAFLYQKKTHKNDVVILFTDAEELGLNGAALFATQHQYAKNVGLALNFEARGTAGPSYMLMETNTGNAKMIAHFCAAKVGYPATNSLMYSIYKMLPNDTDLTIFREKNNIPGFNFAFIDNHFNYHTAQDSYANLSQQSLAHQGSYMLPLLAYFSNCNLSNLTTLHDDVYFNIPFRVIHYPFLWVLPMVVVCIILFSFLIFLGLGKRVLHATIIGKNFLRFFCCLLIVGLVAFLGYKLLLLIYPQYNDIQQGFSYNGHYYIYAFISISIAICFLFYRKTTAKHAEISQFIAPLFVWLLINLAIALQLKGAGFFIIPVFCGLFMLGYFVLLQKINAFIFCLLAVPIFVLIVPLIVVFPVGLGLKILPISCVLTVLCFGLLLPVFGLFTHKKIMALLFFIMAIGWLAKAHLNSNYTNNAAKPNSLVYYFDAQANKAFWATYDINLDSWTSNYLGKNPKTASTINHNLLYSKYNKPFTYIANAPIKNCAKPTITFIKDSVVGNYRYLKIKITPNRIVNRYDVFINNNADINNLTANETKSIAIESAIIGKKSNKLLTYYVVNQTPLTLAFSIKKMQKLDLEMIESSFDLLSNKSFKIVPRPSNMMPMPFVVNDAIIIRQKIEPTKTLRASANIIKQAGTHFSLVEKSIKKPPIVFD